MADPLPDEDPVMVRTDVLAVPLDDSLVLYDPAADRAHVLNRSAAHIWGALRIPTSIDRLVAGLAEATGTSAAVLEPDVRTVIQRFDTERLLGAPRDLPPDPAGLDGWTRIEPEEGETAPTRTVTLAMLDRTVAMSSASGEVMDVLDWFGAADAHPRACGGAV